MIRWRISPDRHHLYTITTFLPVVAAVNLAAKLVAEYGGPLRSDRRWTDPHMPTSPCVSCVSRTAFPASDIGLLWALTRAEEGRPSTAEVVARVEAWRP